MVALVAFLEGLAFGETLENPVCAVIGIFLLVGGIIGLAFLGSQAAAGPSSPARECLESSSSALAEAAISTESVAQSPSNVSVLVTRRPIARGLVLVVCIGLLCGSLMVPLRYTGLQGTDQILFSVSFGFGAVLSSLSLLLAHTLARHCSRGRVQP